MQILKKTRYGHISFLLLKVLIFLGVIIFVGFKLSKEKYLGKVFQSELLLLVESASWWQLALPVMLLPFNWILEALKWRLLARKVAPISLWQAIKGVLSGLAISFITPHALGDYAGRIWQLNNPNRQQLIGAVLLSRLLQLSCTVIFGAYGVYYVLSGKGVIQYFWKQWQVWLLVSCIVLVFILWLLFRRYKLFAESKILNHFIRPYFGILGRYNLREVMQAWSYAALRYLVFFTQLLLLFACIDIQLPYNILAAGVSWIFLAKSVIPTFNFLSDLGVREFSAIYFFDLYNISNVKVVTASMIIWIINILVPTLGGLFFIFQMKLKRN